MGQSVVLPFVRRYMVVYRRILGRNSVSTSIFLSICTKEFLVLSVIILKEKTCRLDVIQTAQDVSKN